MVSHFQADESVAKNLRRLARQRADKALAALESAAGAGAGGEPLAEVVHQTRKDFKKLRALLRLAREGLGRKVFERENAIWRDAGHALSAIRDTQALIGAFDQLAAWAGAGRLPAAIVDHLRSKLVADYEAVKNMATLEERLPGVLTQLRAARQRIDAWPLEKKHRAGWPLLAKGLKTAYRRARQQCKRLRAAASASAAGGPCPDAAAWHALRKRAKDLDYPLRLLRPLWPHELKTLRAELDALAGRLGDDHDLAVLRARLFDFPDSHTPPPPDRETVRPLLAQRREALQREALEIAGRLFAEKPAYFEARLSAYWKLWRRKKRQPAE